MKLEQIYTGCLAQSSYYVESGGKAAIIDPLRESDYYIEKTQKEGANVQYVFETHFHADFVSGHVDLALRTGGQIIYGPGAKTSYTIHEATDGEVFELGEVKIKVLHTPGHTLESVVLLLFNEEGKEHAIFSGDTLFIGDVGRPDLAQNNSLTQNDLAGMLYDSLRSKIMTLPDDVIVYPAHGAGSACGKNMSNETSDLLGNQKKNNYALRANMTKKEFVKEITKELLPPPRYFAYNAVINKSGASGLSEILKKGNMPLSIAAFEAAIERKNALLLDTRSPEDFAKCHIPNTLFIGIDGDFAPWVGTLAPDLRQSVIFIADPGREEEVVMRLSRVGCDNTLGYLKGGMETWTREGKDIASVESISAEAFAEKYKNHTLNVADVRRPSEYEANRVVRAQNVPLDYISGNMNKINKNEVCHIYCARGYRSMIAASILKSKGYHHIVNVAGGFKAISETGIPRALSHAYPTTD